MNKAIAGMVINNWKRKNNTETLTNEGGALEYQEGIKFLGELEETMKVSGPFDPAYEFLARQRREVYMLVEALNITFDLEQRDHLQSFKIMASFPVKQGRGCVEMFVEEVEVFISKLHKTNNKQVIIREIESSYRFMKEEQGIGIHALKDLEIVLL